MYGPEPRGDDAAAEYDVMTAEPMGNDDDDGFNWDANELARGQGEPESEPLDDLDEDAGEDDLEAAEDSGEAESGDGEDGEGVAPIEPPSNWPAQEQQFFKSLPPQLQQAYMARAQHMVADYTRKTQAIAQQRQQIEQKRQEYANLERVISPHVQNWRLNGMHPDQAIAQLIELSNFATNDPTGFIKYFSNLRGVDLQSLTQEQEYVDPQVAALQRPVAEVQARLNQLTQQLQQSQVQQQQQAYSAAFHSTSAALDDIASQTDETGKPLYPFFNEVEGDMAALIESGYARSVPEAYKKAVRLNEQVSAKIAARSRAEQNARARQQTERARRAASSLTGASSAGNGAYSNGDLSVREALNAAWQGNL